MFEMFWNGWRPTIVKWYISPWNLQIIIMKSTNAWCPKVPIFAGCYLLRHPQIVWHGRWNSRIVQFKERRLCHPTVWNIFILLFILRAFGFLFWTSGAQQLPFGVFPHFISHLKHLYFNLRGHKLIICEVCVPLAPKANYKIRGRFPYALTNGAQRLSAGTFPNMNLIDSTPFYFVIFKFWLWIPQMSGAKRFSYCRVVLFSISSMSNLGTPSFQFQRLWLVISQLIVIGAQRSKHSVNSGIRFEDLVLINNPLNVFGTGGQNEIRFLFWTNGAQRLTVGAFPNINTFGSTLYTLLSPNSSSHIFGALHFKLCRCNLLWHPRKNFDVRVIDSLFLNYACDWWQMFQTLHEFRNPCGRSMHESYSWR